MESKTHDYWYSQMYSTERTFTVLKEKKFLTFCRGVNTQKKRGEDSNILVTNFLTWFSSTN